MNRTILTTLCLSLLAACGTGIEDASEPSELLDSDEGAATAATPRCEMFVEQACLLNTSSSSSKRTFEVHYPTLAFCGVRLIPTRFATDLQGFANELEASLADEGTVAVPIVVGRNSLRLGVGTKSLYIVDVTLRTKSGRSLSRVIQEKLGGQLVAVPQPCPGRE